MCMVVFVYFGNDCAKYVVFGVTINEVKKYACKFLNVCCYDLYTQEDINVSNWAYAYMYKGCYFKYKPFAVLCIIIFLIVKWHNQINFHENYLDCCFWRMLSKGKGVH